LTDESIDGANEQRAQPLLDETASICSPADPPRESNLARIEALLARCPIAAAAS
jgi:hypothetical protein